MKRWLMFCEADADHRTASLLIDEILRLRCAQWVRDQLDLDPGSVRQWHPDILDRPWFDVHRVYAQAAQLGVQISHGHFGGEPAAAGARMLDTIFRIVRRLQREANEEFEIEAVVVVWDMDRQRRARHAGLAQPVREGRLPSGVRLVVGCPDPMRETWILAGFVPLNDRERELLESARKQLGFWPNERPHELTAGNEQALRHAKRVMAEDLEVTTYERERYCLRIPDDTVRADLAARGVGCGLDAYLCAVESRLVPLVDPSKRFS